jgi:hypothetical protein
MRSAATLIAGLSCGCGAGAHAVDPSDSLEAERRPNREPVAADRTPKHHGHALGALVDVVCANVTARGTKSGELQLVSITRSGGELLRAGDWFECVAVSPGERPRVPCKARSVSPTIIEALCPSRDASIFTPPVAGTWGCNVTRKTNRRCAATVAECERFGDQGQCDVRTSVICTYLQGIVDGRLEYLASCYEDEKSCELARQGVSATFATTAPHFLKVGPKRAPVGHCHAVP